MGFALQDWQAVRFSGADRLEWLQGQLTHDVLRQEDSLFCWLEPSGRCLAFGGLHIELDHVDLYVPKSTVDSILKRVEEMVIMEDVEANLTDGQVEFEPTLRLILSDGSEKSDQSDGQFDAMLLECGFPLWGVDINERSIPFDLGDAFADAAVSPNKGCYVGQEIIARMRSHEQKPRDWVGLILEGPVEPGCAVETFGTVTRYAFSQTLGHIASASISKKNLVEGEIVEVSTVNGKVKAEVRHMPLLRD